mgnify:CR=1 FL=1
MLNLKKIGISTRIITNDIGLKQDKVPHSLVKILEEHKALPIIIPNISDISYYLDICDGFIVPGGITWNETDIKIIKYVFKVNKPLLGICTGMQALANIDTFVDNTIKVDNHNVPNEEYVHEISINDGILKSILNKDKIKVNSRHNYKVEPKDYFKIDAVSYDEVIEAISFPEFKFIVGLEWHPEDMDDEDQNKIFKYFISKC